MKKITSYILLLLVQLLFVTSNAQTLEYNNTKEKIYVQTNHVFFKPGETAFFKLYVVNAKDQTPTRLSNVAYAEIINPAGSVVQKLNLRIENGYAEGSYDFVEGTVGGIYKLRFHTSWMKNEKEESFFVKELTLQKVIAPRVLLKLEFPEKGYGATSEVKSKFSMRNLNDEPIKNYEAKFTVSVGGEIIATQNFKTDFAGKAEPKFTLPKDLSTTDGLLNITVQYDGYTESISRSIPIVLNKIDLQFMPESGTMVEGLPAVVAFKAMNEFGKAADIKGELIDEQGNKLASIESYHFGMGRFSFIPGKDKSYKVRITSPANITKEYSLPATAQNGVVMNITKAEHQLAIKLFSTSEREVKLTAQTKNISYYSTSIFLKRGENSIVIDEKTFPVGIAQFTLSTANNLPLCERLYFLNEDKNLQVSISTDKKSYSPREKVKLTIKSFDENGKPMPSNFSIAVIDDKLWSFADDKQDHILSWLLLSSELKGKIEEPQFYFKKDESKAIPALDLLMLTHGYRYFDYIDYVINEGKTQFNPDQDNILSGLIENSKKQAVKATVYLVNTRAGGKAMKIQTDTSGVFFFSQIPPGSNYYLFAQGIDKGERVAIKILQQGVGYNPMNTTGFKLKALPGDEDKFNPLIQSPGDRKFFGKEREKEMLAKPIQMMAQNAQLNEVVVVGYGSQRRSQLSASVSVVQAKDITAFYRLDNALQGRAAGLQVIQYGNPGAAKITIRGASSLGSNQPMYVVNGVPVENFSMGNLSANDIESITVLKDAAATSIYGARAASGAILIQSKKLYRERLRVNLAGEAFYASQIVQFAGNVYSVAKRFYVPKYTSIATNERTDFRETIYWNAVVQTNSKGEATVEFYNSDASTTFRAIAEGISYNGKCGMAEATYVVKNVLSVDAKIPLYLTIGDKALVPLVIKNNSDEAVKLFIEVKKSEKIKAGTYPTSVSIEANTSKQILIPIEALASLKEQISFIVSGETATEKITLRIEAAGKGFPIIETFAGNKSKQHNFSINKMIPGSLKTNLKLYKNLEGQLLDGIESMLREPYGCFEQTSSSTYPNIFVLKYLKQAGKSNPEIEKKALGYIDRGYKRLTGFETKQNGFEWFGNTPPHEALTAYGLLEFTDMQEFVDVDKKMLERTKKFLLDRRNGDGTFKLANGGYDRFASVPNKIANVYIVYALTQAGIGNEIKQEYEAAVKSALESKDGYRLSMMAVAASNMKNAKDFEMLMKAANESYTKQNLASETSVTNSRYASLYVESMSLYALALLREASPNVGRVAEVISKILAEKSYYGYGSTQATVLALNAVVEYAKLAGKILQDGQVNFMVNNRAVDSDKTNVIDLQEGANVFAVRYSDDSKTVPYNLEVAYNTFTPPNSDKAELKLASRLATNETKVGETMRMQIEVTNIASHLQPMAIAKIGIPAGLSIQPWQLKEILERKEIAYYEIFDNYLVFYWMGFKPGETKQINLDLKAEIAGTYKAKASNTYLYYTPEHKNWNDGAEILIKE